MFGGIFGFQKTLFDQKEANDSLLRRIAANNEAKRCRAEAINRFANRGFGGNSKVIDGECERVEIKSIGSDCGD